MLPNLPHTGDSPEKCVESDDKQLLIFDVNCFIRKTLSNFELSNVSDHPASDSQHRCRRNMCLNTRYISEPESSTINNEMCCNSKIPQNKDLKSRVYKRNHNVPRSKSNDMNFSLAENFSDEDNNVLCDDDKASFPLLGNEINNRVVPMPKLHENNFDSGAHFSDIQVSIFIIYKCYEIQ